ncbi:hypothetical protein [Streptomyces sp. DT171]|uniref:hypothetical protein n=1 Tax=Streptomyces sp. DT171 TaxID=3416524 RepID=UPI003CF9CF92
MSVDSAADALRNVDTARAGARLRAGLTPAWYGPAAAAALIVPGAGGAWGVGRGAQGALVSLVLSLGGLAVTVGLVRATRRATGVVVTRTWFSRLRRGWLGLLVVLVAGIAGWVLCRQAGAGEAVTRMTVFTVWGLGAWSVCAMRNAAIRQKLREPA